MDHTLEERIRERAYQIWNACGCTDGQAEEHWFTAEREVLSGLILPGPAAQPKTTSKTRSRSARTRRN
jgi:hypothetical protein